jgi:hypothetical protein
MKKPKQKKAGDILGRDFLGAIYAEEMPAQDCVSEIYEQWEKLREHLPAVAKAEMTKQMKSFLRVAKIDPAALPMVLAMNPDYNLSLKKYLD